MADDWNREQLVARVRDWTPTPAQRWREILYAIIRWFFRFGWLQAGTGLTKTADGSGVTLAVDDAIAAAARPVLAVMTSACTGGNELTCSLYGNGPTAAATATGVTVVAINVSTENTVTIPSGTYFYCVQDHGAYYTDGVPAWP